jgi:hypothetical protein
VSRPCARARSAWRRSPPTWDERLDVPPTSARARRRRCSTCCAAGRRTQQMETRASTDFTQGLIERREESLVAGARGPGLLRGRDAAGRGLHAQRQRRFHIDDQGEGLQTPRAIRSPGPARRGRVQPTGEPVTVDATGKVRQARERGRASSRWSPSPTSARLSASGNGYFRAGDSQARACPATAVVAPGRQRALQLRGRSTSSVALIRVQHAATRPRPTILRSIDQSYRASTSRADALEHPLVTETLA